MRILLLSGESEAHRFDLASRLHAMGGCVISTFRRQLEVLCCATEQHVDPHHFSGPMRHEAMRRYVATAYGQTVLGQMVADHSHVLRTDLVVVPDALDANDTIPFAVRFKPENVVVVELRAPAGDGPDFRHLDLNILGCRHIPGYYSGTSGGLRELACTLTKEFLQR